MELGVDVGQQDGALARLGEHQGHRDTLVSGMGGASVSPERRDSTSHPRRV